MRRINLAAIILLASAVLCVAAARAEQVENPSYKAWANFKPGTSVTMQGTNEAGGQKADMKVTTTLVEVTDDHVSLEVSTTITVGDKTQSLPAQKTSVAKMVDKAEMGQQGKGFDPDLLAKAKEEKITVPAGTFTAKAIEFEKQQGPMKMTIKSWFSEEVPGGSVKLDVTGAGSMSMHTTMELASIDKK